MAFKHVPIFMLLSMTAFLAVDTANIGFLLGGTGDKNEAFADVEDPEEEFDVVDADIEEDAARVARSARCCPDYWTKLGQRCYRYFNEKKTWHNARSTCTQFGADLPTIRSYAEGDALYHLWKGLNYYSTTYAYWIGLQDSHREGHFTWSDGSSSTYRNWYSREPNNKGNEDCVHVFNRGSDAYHRQQWNDAGCDYTFEFFCSKHVD